jgi:hypothetical protein
MHAPCAIDFGSIAASAIFCLIRQRRGSFDIVEYRLSVYLSRARAAAIGTARCGSLAGI